MLNASTLFDTRFYLAFNPDVAAAVATGSFSSGLEHFEKFGQFEGRNPGPFFDLGYYRQRHTDVLAAVESGEITEFEHFIKFGQFENRDPNPLFDTNFYLATNPDVAAAIASGKVSAFEHFIKFGQFENRKPSPIFDGKFYLQAYPDVADAIFNKTIGSAFEHYLRFGLQEGRLSTSPNSKDALNGAIDLGSLNEAKTISDSLENANSADIYRFILNTPGNFSLAVNGLSADVDVELIQDINGNGVIESEDIFASSNELGTANEAINLNGLPTDTYFVRISQFEGETNYNLSLSVV